MINLYDLDRGELTELLAEWEFSQFYAQLVWRGMYRENVAQVTQMDALRDDLMARLSAETTLAHPTVIAQQKSADGSTEKFLLQWPDGQAIETVIMAFRGRYTACVSSQAGCAMGCVFCATGQMGFMRHLTPEKLSLRCCLSWRGWQNGVKRCAMSC